MHNRFTIKDFFLVVLVLISIVVGIWSLTQNDRSYRRIDDMLEKLTEMKGQVGRVDNAMAEMSTSIADMQAALSKGVRINSGDPGAGGAGPDGSSSPSPSSANDQDASWAVPGVEIHWQPAPGPTSDPRLVTGAIDGGEISEVWEAQTKIITPMISTDVYSQRVQDLVMEPLAAYDPKTLKMRGVLAQAWQIDPEGMWLRARLRAGLRFSDGVPLTAEDIRFTFHDMLMNLQIEAERSRSIMADSIERVEAIDARTVEFRFKQKLFSNVTNALGMDVLPKHFYSKLTPGQINKGTGLLMGSGPFRLKTLSVETQWAPPKDIVLERNEQYWGKKPVVARLRYQGINEEIGRLNVFMNGDADIITPSASQYVSKQQVPAWQDAANFLKWTNMRTGYSFIAWNCGERNGRLTPFHDKRVRRAMTHAIDRWKLIRDIGMGLSIVSKGNQPPGSPGSNPDIEPWPYDPEESLRLLKLAGWDDINGDGVLEDSAGNEFSFEFTYPSGSEVGDRRARFIQDALKEIGIRCTLRPMEWTVFQDVLKTRDFDAVTLGWGANAPESDPRQAFHSESIQNQQDNFQQWSNKKADALIDAGRRELDDEKRAAIWRDLEAVLHDEQPYTFMTVGPWLRIVSKKIDNVNMYPKGLEPSEYVRVGGADVPAPLN